jgi:hypothetical protein
MRALPALRQALHRWSQELAPEDDRLKSRSLRSCCRNGW